MYTKNCPNCNKLFETSDKRQKHCSKSCSAERNNKLVPRRHLKQFKRHKNIKPEHLLCKCGNAKKYDSSMCFNCFRMFRILNYESRTLDEVRIETKQSAFVKVRQHAKRKFIALNIPKICKCCGYDKYVELAHLKPICSFSGATTIGEINSINNLAYLCPNHHKELDTGIIDISGVTGSSARLGS